MEFTCQAVLDAYQSATTDIKLDAKIQTEADAAYKRELQKVLISNDMYALIEVIKNK